MRTYDPATVTVTFNSLIIDGFGPDTFIKAARAEDGWSFQSSNSGGGARSRNPNKSGTVEITLLASAPANALLQAIADTDELSGEGVGELLVKDRSTANGKCTAQNAWIKKMPDMERAKEVGTVTWVIECEALFFFHDGVIDA